MNANAGKELVTQTHAKDITLDRSERVTKGLGFFAGLAVFAGAWVIDLLNGGSINSNLHLITASVGGFTTVACYVSSSIALSLRNTDDIRKTLFGAKRMPDGFKPKKIAKKDKVLVNSFHIRDFDEVTLGQWVNPANAIPSHTSTHTVNQYLRKVKGGFLVEQEIIPNDETLWDSSANALVEVYGVREAENMTDTKERLNS